MDHPEGASETSNVRLGFDRRVRLEFHGSKISFDGGLLLFREQDEVLGLNDIAGGSLRDTRTGHNRPYSLVGLLRHPCGPPSARLTTDSSMRMSASKPEEKRSIRLFKMSSIRPIAGTSPSSHPENALKLRAGAQTLAPRAQEALSVREVA